MIKLISLENWLKILKILNSQLPQIKLSLECMKKILGICSFSGKYPLSFNCLTMKFYNCHHITKQILNENTFPNKQVLILWQFLTLLCCNLYLNSWNKIFALSNFFSFIICYVSRVRKMVLFFLYMWCRFLKTTTATCLKNYCVISHR